MAQTKKLEKDRWSEYLSMFSNGNRGRMIVIELESMAIGDQTLTDAMPLLAIDYDPANKGDDLIITAGLDKIDYTHKISAPAEIWELQDDNGNVVSVEVINGKGERNIIVFKS
jgi:hypothetical protein